tara:strand:+ start:578 stop:952 length:375 start_codon:yes stop_codon:yes gene_type:complete
MKENFNMPKNNPFKVPNGYFEELTNNIQAECYQEKVSIWSFFKLQTLAPTLAILVLVFMGVKSFTPINNTSISADELYALVGEEVMNWDENLLYEYIDYSEEENEYIQYLLDEEIELTTILNEL